MRPENLPQFRYVSGSTLSNILQIKAYVTEFIFRKLLGEQVIFLLCEYSLLERQLLVVSIFWSLLIEHYTATSF